MEIDRRIRERLWHPPPRIEEREFGSNAEVVEPESLRAGIQAEVDKIEQV